MNIIRITPDELGYKDRGKLKWEQKMMLSDHSEALEKFNKEKASFEVHAKKEMSEKDISSTLYYAYINRLPTKIQADKNGDYYRDVHCMIAGQKDQWIYLKLQNGRKAKCHLDMIRNIEFMDVGEWYNKNLI